MKNPYIKILIWHAIFTTMCFIPFAVMTGETGFFLTLASSTVGNLGLACFLSVCVFETEIKKWGHLKEKEYREWQEELDRLR